jgi:hypothetical protein
MGNANLLDDALRATKRGWLTPELVKEAIDSEVDPIAASSLFRDHALNVEPLVCIAKDIRRWLAEGKLRREVILSPDERQRLPELLAVHAGVQPAHARPRRPIVWWSSREQAFMHAAQYPHLSSGLLFRGICWSRDVLLVEHVGGIQVYLIPDPRKIRVEVIHRVDVVRAAKGAIEMSRSRHEMERRFDQAKEQAARKALH